MKVEWVDELPGKPVEPRRRFYQPRADTQELHEHAAQLVKRPMVWAKYPRPLSLRMANAVANHIREGALAAYSPDLGFESALRGGVIYVRHNPAAANPIRLAYLDGYRTGVRATMERVRKGVWTLRQTLADIEKELDDGRRGPTTAH